MAGKPTHGRKGGQTTLKQLTVLLGALTQSDKPIQAQSVAHKLGISYEEAQRLMDLLIDVAGDETSYLPLTFGENDNELTLISPASAIRPLRLTKAESIALIAALQACGFDSNTPLYQMVQKGYTQIETNTQEIARTVASSPTLTNPEVLLECIKALGNKQCLKFIYASQHSNTKKERLVIPNRLYLQDGLSYLEAHEFASGQRRSFRLDRMDKPQRMDPPLSPSHITDQSKTQGSSLEQDPSLETTTITLLDPVLEELYPWHPVKRTQHADKSVELVIPNYGSPWLIRHLAACGNQVKIKDPQLKKKISDYAQDLLAKHMN